jgi:hypothetical protein
MYFWRRQCNGSKFMLCDGNAKLRAIIAEISNHLIFGNDCRKLGDEVKEGQC